MTFLLAYLLTFSLAYTPRATTYCTAITCPFSYAGGSCAWITGAPAADRRRGNDEPVPVGSIAGDSRQAQAAARARAYDTTGRLLTSECLLPLC